MATTDTPQDDKAKRMRDLLSSFYSQDPSLEPTTTDAKLATLDTIDSVSFDPDRYMNLLVHKSNLEGLLQRHVQMAAEIKNLDTDLQMLVYENYNKFISATDTIKRMKSNIVDMETNMEQLLDKIISVQSRSDGVNTSLFEKREHIEKLHRTRNLLQKIQFIYDLPARLGKCIKSEEYANAVRFYTGAMPILKAYGDTSFQDCKQASEEAISTVIKILQLVFSDEIEEPPPFGMDTLRKNIFYLQGKLFSDTESIQTRAEAAMLLKQLDFPVESLKAKLLEKLEQSFTDLQLKNEMISNTAANSPDSNSGHEASLCEFAEAIRAYRVIFPDSERQLVELAEDLVAKHFEATEQYIKERIHSSDVLRVFRIIWTDVQLLNEVLNESVLIESSIEAAKAAVRLYIDNIFSNLLLDISESLLKMRKDNGTEEYSLDAVLETSKRIALQGSMDVLLDFRQILDENLELVVRIRDLIINWVQEGFQKFFRKLEARFLLLSGSSSSVSEDQYFTEVAHGDKVAAALILVLGQLSVFIEQSVIPRITEEIAASFSGGGVLGCESGPAFVPGEICRIFHSAGEKFLHLYINMRTQKISILLKRRFNTPNWVKHKEPREVHMFVDLFLQELEAIGKEVKQILPQGLRRHRRTDSNGSTTSSRSNPLREEKMGRSNTQRARSQLLETHLAKLFKQKVEIFTKVEHTQDSVVTTVAKLCLKSLQEFVRLQTFNRSGFQQIQLDIQFLRNALKEMVEDEAVMDFLLDEVIVAAAERCLDPIPLEPPILDRLVQAKLSKAREQSSIS